MSRISKRKLIKALRGEFEMPVNMEKILVRSSSETCDTGGVVERIQGMEEETTC
jgi:hypothetical protein